MADSQFPIKIRADLEGQGIKQAREEFSALEKETKAADTAIAKTVLTHDELGKKAEESGKKQVEGAEHAILSHRELRESVRGVSREFGGLADVGLWLNPMTAALAAVLWSVGELTEQHKKLVESFAESIKASQEMRKSFTEGIAEGARVAADKIADLDSAHTHLADSTDTATQSMQRELQISQIIAQSITDQTNAYLSLSEAKIRLQQAQGQITGTDADDRIQALKRDAEKQKEFEEEEAKKAEAKTKSDRAAAAHAESAEATGKLHDMRDSLETSDAAVITQEARLKSLQDQAAKAREAATSAGAEYDASPHAANYLKSEKAEKAAAKAEKAATGAVEHLAALKSENKELNRQADSLAKESDERDTTARKLKEEAGQITAEIAARKKAFGENQAIQDQVDHVTHQAREQNRWHELVSRRNLNPDELDELSDLTARRNEAQSAQAHQPQETQSLVSAANSALDRASHGRGSQAEVHAVLQRIIGHQDANLRESESQSRNIEQLHRALDDQARRLATLAEQVGYHDQRMTVPGYIH